MVKGASARLGVPQPEKPNSFEQNKVKGRTEEHKLFKSPGAPVLVLKGTSNAVIGFACCANIILYKLPPLGHSNEFVWLDFSYEYAKQICFSL